MTSLVAIPIGLLVAGLVLVVLGARASGRCPACGYDRRRDTGERCPECGSERPPTTARRRPWRLAFGLGLWTAVLINVAPVLIDLAERHLPPTYDCILEVRLVCIPGSPVREAWVQLVGIRGPIGTYDAAYIRFVDPDGAVMRPRMRLGLADGSWWWEGTSPPRQGRGFDGELLSELMREASVGDPAWADEAAATIVDVIRQSRAGSTALTVTPFAASSRDANAIRYPHVLAWPAAVVLTVVVWKIGVALAIWRPRVLRWRWRCGIDDR